jgi:hypothetical protein
MAEGSKAFGVEAEELPLVKKRIERALEEGRPVVCVVGPGDFTRNGHYLLLTGCGEQGFTLHDPNSPQKSGQVWSYDTLAPQITNLWAFSRAE